MHSRGVDRNDQRCFPLIDNEQSRYSVFNPAHLHSHTLPLASEHSAKAAVMLPRRLLARHRLLLAGRNRALADSLCTRRIPKACQVRRKSRHLVCRPGQRPYAPVVPSEGIASRRAPVRIVGQHRVQAVASLRRELREPLRTGAGRLESGTWHFYGLKFSFKHRGGHAGAEQLPPDADVPARCCCTAERVSAGLSRSARKKTCHVHVGPHLSPALATNVHRACSPRHACLPFSRASLAVLLLPLPTRGQEIVRGVYPGQMASFGVPRSS